MLNTIFDPDNLFWRGISRLVDIVGLSLFWAILSLPVITAFPATTALYYTVVKGFRQGEERTFRTMWGHFRENLKREIPVSIVYALLIAAIIFGYKTMAAHTDTNFGALMCIVYEVFLILPIGFMIFFSAVMARFSDDIKKQLEVAFLLCIKHLPSAVILVLLNIELISYTLKQVYPLLFVPVIDAFLSSLFLEKIFIKHVDLEGEAKLRGLSVEELMELKASEKKSKNVDNQF